MSYEAKRCYCRLSKCEVEIVWTDRGQPICFGSDSTNGNVCDEEDDNFIELGGSSCTSQG